MIGGRFAGRCEEPHGRQRHPLRLTVAPGAVDAASCRGRALLVGSVVASSRLVPATTEITLREGSRYRVQGDAAAVERLILDAARGSIMELAWLTEVESGERLGINPEAVVMLRAVGE